MKNIKIYKPTVNVAFFVDVVVKPVMLLLNFNNCRKIQHKDKNVTRN